MAGGVEGLDDLPVVPGVLPGRLVHRLVGALGGLVRGAICPRAVVGLTVGGIAHVEVVGGVLSAVDVDIGVAAGAHRLDLQGLQGPAAAHLIGDDPLDVGLQVHDVHHRQVAAADALIAEAAVVPVSLEPGAHGVRPGDVGHHPQGQLVPSVKLEQDLRGSGAGDVDGVGAGACHRAAQALGGVLRLLPAGVGAGAHLVVPVDPGHKAVPVLLGVGGGLLIGAVAALHQHVVTADHVPAVVGVGVGGAVHPGVLGLDHGDLGLVLVRPGQLHKVQVVVKVAHAVARAVAGVVLQVGVHQGAAAIGQAHPDHLAAAPRRQDSGKGQDHRQQNGGKLHKESSHSFLDFSVSDDSLS